MKHLTRTARRFDTRIVDYWSYPVKIGITAAACTMLAILFPILEVNFTSISIYRHLDRSWQYAMAALLVVLLIAACVVPYWGGVVVTLVICPLRIFAYTNTFNLVVYAVYGALMATTLLSVRKQYVLSKWVVCQKEKRDAESA